MKDLQKHFFIYATLWLSLMTTVVPAQVAQPGRYENEDGARNEYYTVISLGERGLALLKEKDKFTGMKKHWDIILLDSALKEKISKEFVVDSRYPFVGYETTPNELLVVYREGETTRNDLVLVSFDLDSLRERERHEVKPEIDLKLTHFSKVGSSLVLGGYVSNDPAILIYNLVEKKIKVVPGFFQKDNELVDLRVNQNQTFNVLLVDRSNRADRKLVFRTFNEEGQLLLEDVIPIEEEKSLQTSMTSSLVRDDLGVFGTWGERTSKQALGFFALHVDPFSDQKIKYYHFGELQTFLDYLSPKRAQRIKENTREDLKAGRKPSFSTYAVPYKVAENENGYVMLAEVYNPITPPPYSSSPYANPYFASPYSYYNPFYPGYASRTYRPYTYGNNVKSSGDVRTLETVLVAFDGVGNILWDQSVKLDDVEKPSMEQVADFYTSDSLTVLVYKKKSEIRVKRISRDTGKITESTHKIELLSPTDELRDERENDGGVGHWTDNRFYVWGFQTIRDASKKGDKTRNVFYINKLVVD